MKIGINFHTTDRYISGVEYYSLGLINSLLCLDGENEYVVFTNQPQLLASGLSASENLTVRKSNYLQNRVRRILWEHSRLPRIAKNEGMDVVHCPHYICPFLDAAVPYVVTIHDTIAIEHPQWCKLSNALYYNIFMKPSVSKASRVIAVSHSTADSLKRRFPAGASKLRVIYPGIDTIFNSKKDPSGQTRVKSRYGLPERYILFVGNIEPKKNILNLVRAYKLLRLRGLSHKLVLAGKRTWKSKGVLKEISGAAPGSILAIGYVDRVDLPFVYQMADVFVFASLYEGFGFPPLEAMACGTPVVASTGGALTETAGGASRTVDPTNPEDIAEAIYLLITNRKLRQKHLELGIRQSRRFNWDETAKRTLSVYQEAAQFNECNK
jgi:glycosyltransferase involved in cell wall biosynthesis